jgi:hypothetical protein
MVLATSPDSRFDLERYVSARTGRRIRNLAIELLPERVVLRGEATSYYIKQLAQQGVRELLPLVRLENSITVGAPAAEAAAGGA